MINTDTEQLFKDKVDWKFYNFVKDRVIEYEDNGGLVEIRISVRGKSDIAYRSIYKYETNIQDRFLNVYGQVNLEFFKEQCGRYGLYYEVDIFENQKDKEISIKSDVYTNAFIDKMRDRCIIVDDFPIVLQPKFK